MFTTPVDELMLNPPGVDVKVPPVVNPATVVGEGLGSEIQIGVVYENPVTGGVTGFTTTYSVSIAVQVPEIVYVTGNVPAPAMLGSSVPPELIQLPQGAPHVPPVDAAVIVNAGAFAQTGVVAAMVGSEPETVTIIVSVELHVFKVL